MFVISNNNNNSVASLSDETLSSVTRVHDFASLNPLMAISLPLSDTQPQLGGGGESSKLKKKRNLPGNPDPDAEVIALSPKTLMATNRFVCEICNKGFQRDQNLQLHRRGHNLPWKLKQRNTKEMKKKAYVCPELTCVHHHPSRALGDLTGIKKHFCRKHGEKKWKCEKCSKVYAVQSDWKAHSKTCGTREYKCDCGTLFSRKDSFITHRAFCDALAQESARLSAAAAKAEASNPESAAPTVTTATQHSQNLPLIFPFSSIHPQSFPNPIESTGNQVHPLKTEILQLPAPSQFYQPVTSRSLMAPPFPSLHASRESMSTSADLSATALLQKAATVGSQSSVRHMTSTMTNLDMGGLRRTTSIGISQEFVGFATGDLSTWQKTDGLTRDFLGLTGDNVYDGGANKHNGSISAEMRTLATFTGGINSQHQTYERDNSMFKPHGFC